MRDILYGSVWLNHAGSRGLDIRVDIRIEGGLSKVLPQCHGGSRTEVTDLCHGIPVTTSD